MRLGRYETLRTIATGGMATVHLGRSVGAGGFERLVAIKVMHAHIAGDPDFVSMFLDEARLAARIRHPNVVGTIDIQEEGETLFLVMDYVEGPSLSQMNRALRRQGQMLPVGITTRIFMDVLAGLHAAHELKGEGGQLLGLVHRDMSPPNVLVGHEGISRITDFGVARANARLTLTRGGQVKGKLQYMAPEQARSDTVDRRTDVYAAGIVLWETLSGKRLFDADNEMALSQMIMQGTQVTPRDHNPNVPQAISDVCMRALSADADKRFPTALAFADSLEDAARVSGSPIAAPRAVASYVKAMELHEPPGDLDLPTQEPRAPARPGMSSAADIPTPASRTPSAPHTPLQSQAAPPAAANANGSVESTVTGPTNAGTAMSMRPGHGRSRGLLIPVGVSAAVGVLVGIVAVFGPWKATDTPDLAQTGEDEETTETATSAPKSTAPPKTLQRAGNAAPPGSASAAAEPTAAPTAKAVPPAFAQPARPRGYPPKSYPPKSYPPQKKTKRKSTFRPDDL